MCCKMQAPSFQKRDAVDARIVKEVKEKNASGMGVFGKKGIIDSPNTVGGWPEYKTVQAAIDSDNDGMPDEWEKQHGLNASNADDRNKKGEGGYTMLEIYLNSLVKNTSI